MDTNHSVRATVEYGYVSLHFTCHAPEGAMCRPRLAPVVMITSCEGRCE
jgi:hypothetical protein